MNILNWANVEQEGGEDGGEVLADVGEQEGDVEPVQALPHFLASSELRERLSNLPRARSSTSDLQYSIGFWTWRAAARTARATARTAC